MHPFIDGLFPILGPTNDERYQRNNNNKAETILGLQGINPVQTNI